MLFNLTPHPMRFFAEHTPDRVAAEDAKALWTLPPSVTHRPVRLGQHHLGWEPLDLPVPVERIRFGAYDSQPATTLPDLVADVFYLVSLPVALSSPGRDDLLVNGATIRDLDGNTLGARSLARPWRP